MTIQEHQELASQGGGTHDIESLEEVTRLVEYIKSFQM
jgi:hypothetical protein